MKSIIPILFPILFFSLMIGLNLYMGSRYNSFFNLNSFWSTAGLFFGITIMMVVGVMGFVNNTTSFGTIMYSTGGLLMGFYLYLLLSTIAVDLIGVFINLKPVYLGLTAIILASLISTYGVWNSYHVRITNVDIPIQGLTQAIKAAHLTDTHIGHVRGPKTLQGIVDKINAQNVDIVFFTGDLLDSKIQLKNESMQPLKYLKAPVYFIEGNHDNYTGVTAIKTYLKSIGIHVLENEVVNWKELQIIGLNHMLADHQSFDMHADGQGPTVQSTLNSMRIENSKPTILLHHGPSGIKYASEHKVDLYLAGHTHAGQVWPATYIANAMFEYNRGLHNYKDTKVYVSQGTGTFGPPMRVGTFSELSILNLVPES